MADQDNPYQLVKPKPFGYHLKLPEIRLGSEPLQTYAGPPPFWLVPLTLDRFRLGDEDYLRLYGKLIDPEYRRHYLLQTPLERPDPSCRLSLYTDNTPDFLTQYAQFNAGFTGFGFHGEGKLFIQGGASRPDTNNVLALSNPSPVHYDSYLLSVSTGPLPLAILKRHQLSVDMQFQVEPATGKPAGQLTIEYKKKDSPFKSINLGMQGLSTDWRRKLNADEAGVWFEFRIPGL
jgi:hypothetical protein